MIVNSLYYKTVDMKNETKPKEEIKIVSRPSNEEIEEDLTKPVKKWKTYHNDEQNGSTSEPTDGPISEDLGKGKNSLTR